MPGRELPPFISGGLGTACKGLVNAMERLDTPAAFVLPRSTQNREGAASRTRDPQPPDPITPARTGGTLPHPDARPSTRSSRAEGTHRSGERINQATDDIERAGMRGARRVIAVSRYTGRIIGSRHGVRATRIVVVHNGIDHARAPRRERPPDHRPTVLYLGRITRQKDPEYFVRAAARVARRILGARFLASGWGDQGPTMIEQSCAHAPGSKMRFSGFLRGDDADERVPDKHQRGVA